MPSLDVFKSSAFSMMEMSANIQRAPFVPGRIGATGIFKFEPVTTTVVELVREGGTIALLPSKPRGSRGSIAIPDKRKSRNFSIPHIPHDDQILADSIQNIRAWGPNATELDAVAAAVSRKLDRARQNHELTQEWLRIGAIKGVIVDGDGSTTLYDLFSEFGISESSVDFLLGTTTTDVKGKVESVRRLIEDALGLMTFSGIHAYCGNTFWDKLISHPQVVDSYKYAQSNQTLRETQRGIGGEGSFEWCGVVWENYRGKVASTPFIPLVDCRFVPDGVPDLFLEHFAPADMIDTVNTPGERVYAIQEEMPRKKGIDIHTQSNPLPICTRPEVLIKGTTSN